MKLKSFFALMLSASLFLFGCSDPEEVTPDPDPDPEVEVVVEGISVSPTSCSIEEGKTFGLTATLSPSGATGEITWASEDESIATVSNGTVTALVPGETNIVATCEGYSASCAVTVTEIVRATGITLDQTVYSLVIGKDFTLTATLEPSGAVGDIVWSSEDDAIASVTGGKVVGNALGTTNIIATCDEYSAYCEVTVIEDPDAPEDPTSSAEISLAGTDYYLFIMDDVTYSSISDKVVADLRPDDVDTFVWNWNGYNDGVCEGTNAYGQDAGWVSRIVQSGADWSGLGFSSGNSGDYSELNLLANVTAAPDEFYLHVAFKASIAVSHLIKFESDNLYARITIGNNGSMWDDVEYPVAYTYESDGEWHHLDIPVTAITASGFAFSSSCAAAANTLILLSGAVADATLDIDAAFFYKK